MSGCYGDWSCAPVVINCLQILSEAPLVHEYVACVFSGHLTLQFLKILCVVIFNVEAILCFLRFLLYVLAPCV